MSSLGSPTASTCSAGDGIGTFTALRDGVAPDRLDEIVDSVNARVPYYKHLHHVALVDAVPRSANGKLVRADLRTAMLAHVHGGNDGCVHHQVRREG